MVYTIYNIYLPFIQFYTKNGQKIYILLKTLNKFKNLEKNFENPFATMF